MAARVALLALLLASGAARAETRPPYGGRVIGSLLAAPASLDPLQAKNHAELTLASLVYDTLYHEGGEPHLAEGPLAVSGDGLEARLTVRPGVLFHDGRTLGAADVAATLQRARGEWMLAMVATVEASGNDVILRLRRPAPELQALLALPQLGVLPGGRPGKAPIGSGPFRVKRLAAEQRRVELEAAPEHWAGRPYVDAAVLRWFEDADDEPRGYEAGEADISQRGAVAFAGHEPKYPTVAAEARATVLVYLGFGRAHGALLDAPETRAAISQAIGRASLRRIGSGERVLPSASPASPDLGGAVPTAADLAARPEAASRLGALRGITLTILVDRSRPDDVEVASRVVAALDRAGIAAMFTVLGPADMTRRAAAGLCDLYVGQLAAPSTDPVWSVAAAFAAGGDGWAVDKLRAGALGLEMATAAFAARLPVIPLFHRGVRLHHKRTLRGLEGDPLGRPDLADAFFWSGPVTEADGS